MSDFKNYPCDVCGCSSAVEVPFARLYTNEHPVHICKKCGFVYVKSRRSAKVVAELWNSRMYEAGAYTARIPAVKARQTYAADFFDVNIPLKGLEVVDIGAGEGEFLSLLRDGYGAAPFGIEPSPVNCNRMADLGIECFSGTIEDALGHGVHKDRQFDAATIIWTLENCTSCNDMLSGARALLKKGGYLLVSTGSRILVPYKKRLDDYFVEKDVDLHAFRFSANTLRLLLMKNGFTPVRINRYQDTDYLCVIARKETPEVETEAFCDDWLMVHSFFERWHAETVFFRGL